MNTTTKQNENKEEILVNDLDDMNYNVNNVLLYA